MRTCLTQLCLTGLAKKHNKWVPSISEIKNACKIRDKINYPDSKISMSSMDTNKFYCGGIICVTIDGDVTPCSVIREGFGNIHEESLEKIVEKSLKDAALYEEVGDRLGDSAMGLSGGQQQRLCIARTLAIQPEVILMDEPCSALDPIATAKIEDLIDDLKKNYTVIIVTHNMQQAARVSDYTGFFYLGKLIEFGETKQIFENPKEDLTEKYMTGRFG